MLHLIAMLALAADGKAELHPRRAAQVECVAALGLIGNDQARNDKAAKRFPKIAGKDQILAGAVARQIMAETGRSEEQVRALYKAEINRLQTGSINAADPKAYVDGRVMPCLPWLKAIDPKAGPDGVVSGLNDGIPPITPETTSAPVPAPPPAPAPPAKMVAGALSCVARMTLAHDEVAAREGNSKTALALADLRDRLSLMAGKGKMPNYDEILANEIAALRSQQSSHALQRAMGIPDEESAREKPLSACITMAQGE